MKTVVAVSGGFDPPHSGHFDLWEDAAKLGEELIIILNSDKFLSDKRKKLYDTGFVIQDMETRYRTARKWADHVIFAIDKDETVCKTLKMIAGMYPSHRVIFANGGDRDSYENIPETKVCEENNIEMVFGIGGTEKKGASRDMIEKVASVIRGNR